MNTSTVSVISKKSKRTKKIIISIASVLVFLFVIVFALSAYVSYKLVHISKVPVPAITTFPAAIVPQGCKEAEFKDIKNEIDLKGWYFTKKGSDTAVILAHGYTENRMQFDDNTFILAKAFLAHNYNFLMFDFRNAGNSGGNMSSIGYYEKNDLIGAIKYAKGQGAKHIVLLGYSMGASTAALAGSEDAKDVDAMILDCPYADLKEFLDKNMGHYIKPLPASIFKTPVFISLELFSGLNPSDISPKKEISKFAPKPVFFIGCEKDDAIPIENMRDLYNTYKKYAGDKTIKWEIPGLNHVQGFEKKQDEYLKRVFDFLNTVYPKK